MHNWAPEFIEGRQQLVSLLHDYTQDLAGIQAPVLLIRTVAAIIPWAQSWVGPLEAQRS